MEAVRNVGQLLPDYIDLNAVARVDASYKDFFYLDVSLLPDALEFSTKNRFLIVSRSWRKLAMFQWPIIIICYKFSATWYIIKYSIISI
jgi:hypothetical protein